MLNRRIANFVYLSAIITLGACSSLLAGPSVTPDNHIELNNNGIYVSESGQATIARVVSTQSGWVCVQADLLSRPGRLLGCSAVTPGESRDVPISLELAGLTWTLHSSLYLDAGTPGQLEIPDPDLPVLTPLGRPITAEGVLLADPSWITATDQVLGDGKSVVIQRVFTPVPGLLVIHDLRDERVLGYAPLQIGENLAVPVTLEIRGEVSDVFAELHWDVDADHVLDNLSDPAARLSSAEYLMEHFKITGG